MLILQAPYIEFATASNFSFLRGASHPEELMVQAAHVGLAGLGLCDRNSVAGVVRAHLARREQKLPINYHPGARLVFADGTPDILAYPRDRAGWGRLTRLLTLGNLRGRKGECLLMLDDLIAHAFGLELIVMETSSASPSTLSFRGASIASEPGIHTPQHRDYGFRVRAFGAPRNDLIKLRTHAPGRVRLAASMLYRGQDRARLARLKALARETSVPLIAVNDVHYHHPDRRPLPA
jgi:error-prone DNA polymerase